MQEVHQRKCSSSGGTANRSHIIVWTSHLVQGVLWFCSRLQRATRLCILVVSSRRCGFSDAIVEAVDVVPHAARRPLRLCT